ncbi:hypothetical protein BASA61_004576 [Batrachochytrium salamandrivorans]|nr:hypothetical protein BASA61_004576 [Batrachochytrium salamandrivorans]
MINGVSISNHQAAAHVNNGEVTSFSSSFDQSSAPCQRDFIVSAAEATVDFAKASATASAQLGIPVYSEFEHILEYVELPDGKVVYAYKFQLRDDPCDQVGPVNLFYVSNVMHDITYQYGFTEKAGNFQKDNFDKGGQGNDAVSINVLNSRGVNNAQFLSLPLMDNSGEMNMYRFTYTTPGRSGGLDNGIQIHEYAHGISNRLTGGSSTSGCLRTAEAQGMGEGWSDVLAMIVLAKSSDTATTSIPIGAYVKTSQSQSAGNIVAMKIIMGGMMLQPCNPSFLGARDAIIDADVNRYQGAHSATSTRAFAKRGLGLGATDIRTNDFSVPPECQ